MFRFEHPTYLYALFLIPFLTLFFVLMRRLRKKSLQRFGEGNLVNRLMPQVSLIKHPLKFGVLMFALTLLVVAWANPQWGTKRERAKRKASDIIIALDISNSMYADDVKPNRLERARAFTLDLVSALKGERIGSILFAGNAYLQMPLTTDYAAAALFVKSANPNQAPTQGTAISEAIGLAEKAFGEKSQNHKVMIIITDGEDHDSDALDRAQDARENGLVIFTVGVGTTEGGFIPYDFNGVQDYKRDEKGEPIRSKMNEDMMRQLADMGKGEYFNIANTSGVIEALKNRIEKVEKRELEARSFSEYESYFQYFAFPALFILLLEFMMPYRRSVWEGRDIFKGV
jgi:Ca-activated chloride channel family protein